MAANMMDRSDDTIWNDLARTGAGYDSDNPRDWLESELTVDNLVTWIETAYQHRMYLATSEYGYLYNASGAPIVNGVTGYTIANSAADVVKFMNFFIYGTEKTADEDVEIVIYQKKSKFKEI